MTTQQNNCAGFSAKCVINDALAKEFKEELYDAFPIWDPSEDELEDMYLEDMYNNYIMEKYKSEEALPLEYEYLIYGGLAQ
jgi:hypothetical protein